MQLSEIMYLSYIDEIRRCLGKVFVLIRNSAENNVEQAFRTWIDLTHHTRKHGKTVYFVGNGASASMASHFAADLAKNALLHTEVFTDLSLITAIANDLSYDQVFSEPLSRRLIEGDMLVAISSSGKSPNILRAVETAKNLGGKVITLSAMDFDNSLRNMGDINFYVPAKSYGMAETCHAALLHFWIDQILLDKIPVEDKK